MALHNGGYTYRRVGIVVIPHFCCGSLPTSYSTSHNNNNPKKNSVKVKKEQQPSTAQPCYTR